MVPPGTGVGVVTIDAVELAGCAAEPLSTHAGGSAYVPIDFVAPVAASDLVASEVTTGNDADGTSRVTITVTARDADATMELFRSSFGGYPEFDDAVPPGSVPSLPNYPPPARWLPITVTNCGASAPTVTAFCDESPTRDCYYYVAFYEDRYGNRSAVSNMTSGTCNYHKGDVAGGGTPCAGDNQVTTADISALGSLYGVTLAGGQPVRVSGRRSDRRRHGVEAVRSPTTGSTSRT